MKLEEANKLTLEEALNYACSKIVEQGKRSMAYYNGAVNCAYGDEEGNHCAVGWLLDEDNKKLMRHPQPIENLVDEGSLPIPRLIKKNLLCFIELQRFHDAQGIEYRVLHLENLRSLLGLKLDEPYWQQWVEMGDVA